MWVVADRFSTGVRLVVQQRSLRAIQNAPAALQGTQAQVYVAKTHRQGLVKAVDFFKRIAAHQQAGGGDGGDFVRGDEAALMGNVHAVGRQAQEFAVMLGHAKGAHAHAGMLDVARSG